MNIYDQFKTKVKAELGIDLTEEDQQIVEDHHLTSHEVALEILDTHGLSKREHRKTLINLLGELKNDEYESD